MYVCLRLAITPLWEFLSHRDTLITKLPSTRMVLHSPTRSKFLSTCALTMYATTLLMATMAVLVVLLSPSTATKIPAPKPHGRDRTVAHQRSWVVQTERRDSKLAISLFIPLLEKHCTKYCEHAYMPRDTSKAANAQFFGNENADVFESLTFDSCCAGSTPIETREMKVLVLEPGANVSRMIYNQLARQLASLDIAVVTIDRPHDAPVVEFEDSVGVPSTGNRMIKNEGGLNLDAFSVSKEWNQTLMDAFHSRKNEIHFVLDQISEPGFLEKHFPDFNFTSKLDTSSVHLVGHGFGGGVATYAAALDDRFQWAINLSGSIPTITQDAYNYIAFFGREGYTRKDDPNWQASIKHMAGRFAEWTFESAEQMDYTDLPLVASIAGGNVRAKGTGSIGVWAFHCTSCFLEAYVRDTLQGEGGELTKCLQIPQCSKMRPYSG
ncbi:unnamed protein product [Periconia digitata]|uniref:1-alkyl-2-acetylglycerophosphocholine esterase n=1 Tax=Periconia digitata TaxID=1303443 RepID=A0A9W4XPW0_9PLEO|nr:unnamed protein product [Periconia digitata]